MPDQPKEGPSPLESVYKVWRVMLTAQDDLDRLKMWIEETHDAKPVGAVVTVHPSWIGSLAEDPHA